MATIATLNTVFSATTDKFSAGTKRVRAELQGVAKDIDMVNGRMNAMRDAADKVYERTRTPFERLKQQQSELKTLYYQGFISTQTYTRGLSQLREEYNSLAVSANRANSAIKETSGGSLLTGTLGAGELGGFAAKAGLKSVLGGFAKSALQGGVVGLGITAGFKLFETVLDKSAEGLETLYRQMVPLSDAVRKNNEAITANTNFRNKERAGISEMQSTRKSFDQLANGILRPGGDPTEEAGTAALQAIYRDIGLLRNRRSQLAADPNSGFEAIESVDRAIRSDQKRAEAIRERMRQVKAAQFASEQEAERAQQTADYMSEQQRVQEQLKSIEQERLNFGKTQSQLLREQLLTYLSRFQITKEEYATALRNLEAVERMTAAQKEREASARKAAEMQKQQSDAVKRIRDSQESPLDRYLKTVQELRSLFFSGKISQDELVSARVKALQELNGTLPQADPNRRAKAIEFGTAEAFSAQRRGDTPQHKTEKEILAEAQKQTEFQKQLVANFKASGVVTIPQ